MQRAWGRSESQGSKHPLSDADTQAEPGGEGKGQKSQSLCVLECPCVHVCENVSVCGHVGMCWWRLGLGRAVQLLPVTLPQSVPKGESATMVGKGGQSRGCRHWLAPFVFLS